MPKPKRKIKQNHISGADIHQLIEEADKAFKYIYKNMATKEDLRQSEAKVDKKREQNKREIIQEFNRKRQEDKKEIMDGVKAMMEVREEHLQSRVEGKTPAPTPWKSIPRRLKTLEFDMNKVKDHLEIS